LHNTLLAKQYSHRTIRNYTQEMRFLIAIVNPKAAIATLPAPAGSIEQPALQNKASP
jgi:hypothetical protein